MANTTAESTSPLYPVWFERVNWPGMDRVSNSGIKVLGPGDPDDPYRGIEEATAVLAGHNRYDGTVMDRIPNLAIIARTGIGYDAIVVEDATERGICVCNFPEGPTIPAAEQTIALMLSVAKRLPILQRELRQGDLAAIKTHTAVELNQKLLALVGFGRIARRVATIARAIGMEITAFDPYLTDEQFGSVTRATDLEGMVASADVVSIHVPLTPDSRDLFDRRMLGLMKPDAVLVNTSRGPVVNTDALVEAVSSGHLRAVGLDVTDPEPLPVGHPLLGFENVLVSPHVAAWTKEAKGRMLAEAIDQVLSVMAGRRPSYLINPEVLERAGLRAGD
ncbi:MAG: hypothetical protein F4Y83_01415 [Acidimicrobiia bacterium]|nr:hypothetical protein [Acidimicrobiia bacterium]